MSETRIPNRIRQTVGLAVLLGVLIAILAPTSAFAQLTKSDIEAMNRQAQDNGWTFTVGLNDVTQYPLSQLTGLQEPDDWRSTGQWNEFAETKDLPSYFNWQDSMTLVPIRNQDTCGSCWAFAQNGVMENLIMLKDSVEEDLSEQWLISCNDEGYDCDGGWYIYNYYRYLTDPCGDSGTVMEADYPYETANGSCSCPYPHHKYLKSWGWIGGAQYVQPTVEQLKQAIVEFGPISVSIHSTDAFQGYNGGIFNQHEYGTINHAVVLYGWDDSQGAAGVWFLRNSWGESWGDDGYCRIEYECNRVGYAGAYAYYQPVNHTCTPSLAPAPVTSDFDIWLPWEQIDSVQWWFGDGTTEWGLTPTHEYTDPGHYTVEVEVHTPHGRHEKVWEHDISAYADTMAGEVVSLEGKSLVKYDINLTNAIDVKEIHIAFTWDGLAGIEYGNDWSVEGLRTESFEDVRMLAYNPFTKSAAFQLKSTVDGSGSGLAPGSGPVFSVWFDVSASADGSNEIQFVPVGSYDNYLVTYQGEYVPEIENGSIVIGCCIGTKGNIQLEPLCDELDQTVDIGDLTNLINHLFITFTPICCEEEADISPRFFPDGVVDIGDLTDLIDHLFISFNILLPC